jgi:hypothetical protein
MNFVLASDISMLFFRIRIESSSKPSIGEIFIYIKDYHQQDDVMMKYAARLKQKLKMPLQSLLPQ